MPLVRQYTGNSTPDTLRPRLRIPAFVRAWQCREHEARLTDVSLEPGKGMQSKSNPRSVACRNIWSERTHLHKASNLPNQS